jgi:hypothetical protein
MHLAGENKEGQANRGNDYSVFGRNYGHLSAVAFMIFYSFFIYTTKIGNFPSLLTW